MKETLICKLNKHYIYYLSNNRLAFYILVPYREYTETNLAIRLKSNYEMYDLNKNELSKVTSELINYYQDIDNYNITLILPIIFDDTLDRIKTVNDAELYFKMDKYLSEIFNIAYGFLTRKNIRVNSNIYFINNDSFKTFTNWYVSRYNERIEYKDLVDLVTENGSYNSYNVVETPNMNFVVGKEEEPKIEQTFEVEVETFDNMVKEMEKEENNNNNNGGFISYILLGIITFILLFGLLLAFIK